MRCCGLVKTNTGRHGKALSLYRLAFDDVTSCRGSRPSADADRRTFSGRIE
jgi:hypothetical protein